MKEENRNFFWSGQTLKWYRSAAEYSCYHAELAKLVAPAFADCETVCDLGCGTGLLSLALLSYLPRITALDRDTGALSALKEQAGDYPGLCIRQADAMNLVPKDRWDGILLSFFGRISVDDHFRYFMEHCNRTLVCIVNTSVKSSFSSTGVSSMKKEYSDQVERFLMEREIPYTRQDAVLEFGQPLNTLEEARDFINHYSPPGCEVTDEAGLIHILERLPDGRWYLPHRKKIGIFVINKEDLQNEHLS